MLDEQYGWASEILEISKFKKRQSQCEQPRDIAAHAEILSEAPQVILR